MKLLGVDMGTTAAKALVVSPDDPALGTGYSEYELAFPSPGQVEIDAEVYWTAFVAVVRAAVESVDDSHEISALAIASQGETLVPVDAHGRATRPALVWLDSRAEAEARSLAATFDPIDVYARTGQPEIVPTWPACKILWLRNNEPETFAASRAFLLLEDFLLLRLTGERVASRSLHSSSLLLDIRDGGWWDEMLEVVGIEDSQLPSLTDSGQAVGTLTARAAAELGLSTQTVVVTGGLDQVVAAFGAGTGIGHISEMTGAVLAITAPVSTVTLDPRRRLPCHIDGTREKYCLVAWAQTAGILLRWARDDLFAQPGASYESLDQLAAGVSPGADGLIALPHFQGAACPEFEPRARGVLYGLTLQHSQGHIVRALLESVAYMLRANLESIEEIVGPVEEIRSIGGGSRSPLWLQIKADVTQRPVVAASPAESGCMGAALVAGLGAGLFTDAADAISQHSTARTTYTPNPDRAAIYEQRYADYEDLYRALTPLFLKGAQSD